ncbi:MAG: pilus assembly PilX N-terminal domain-containing protein [Desulfobacteraceae bacterium]
MNKTVVRDRNEKGSITVIALMMLVVLTVIGIAVTRTSSTDIRIAGNVVPYKQDFYVAEGGLHREAAELGRGSYPVPDIEIPMTLATSDDIGLPGPAHEVLGNPYIFYVHYEGFFNPPAGYSIIHFSRYDYLVDVKGGNVRVAGRYYKVGPKAK